MRPGRSSVARASPEHRREDGVVVLARPTSAAPEGEEPVPCLDLVHGLDRVAAARVRNDEARKLRGLQASLASSEALRPGDAVARELNAPTTVMHLDLSKHPYVSCPISIGKLGKN
jgi:hypothetical protein